MFTLDEYKSNPNLVLSRLDTYAKELAKAKAKVESTKAWVDFAHCQYLFDEQKKDTVARLQADGVNFTVKAESVTCAFIGAKSLDKEALETFLKAHGASLVDFEKDSPYFRVTPK